MTRSVPSVLIIDDEPILARNIGTYLRRNGFEVRIASSAEAGLLELKTFKPNAIILDFSMPPGMNGLEALAKIHAIDTQIKVIMMTAYGSDELATKALSGGACQFVTKPVSFSTLKQLLEDAVLGKPPDETLL